MKKGFVLFITGIPSSGKTTLASNLAEFLRARGYSVEVLDAFWVRNHICLHEGYDTESGRKIITCTAWIARLLARNGVIVLCSFVTPSRSLRELFKKIVGEEVPVYEVYLKCNIDVCRRRDNKRLYERLERGEIEILPGVTIPYEESPNPDLTIDTSIVDEDKTLEITLKFLEKKRLLQVS